MQPLVGRLNAEGDSLKLYLKKREADLWIAHYLSRSSVIGAEKAVREFRESFQKLNSEDR